VIDARTIVAIVDAIIRNASWRRFQVELKERRRYERRARRQKEDGTT
jgi:hypothetical protein